ncbi:hypothetical protein [Actinoplanes sp. GCM10030250]|uniref:hypothetical protein n=1 Tax=Actinoplanes sp. GCM10030250 TaxID=3273376 RepID=UPI0036079837
MIKIAVTRMDEVLGTHRARAQRPKLLLLTHYAGPEVGQWAAYLWSVLSRAGHHHCYELGVTAAELTRYRTELLEIIALLDAGVD